MKPWLWLPAQLSHDLAPLGLELAALTSSLLSKPIEANVRSFTWKRRGREIFFRNPLGIAGGVDKDGRQISGWKHFGAGFVEIGTVTPLAQKPNPGRIMARETESEALWNRMGFPSPGAHSTRLLVRDWRVKEALASNESGHDVRFPIFINIGKQRDTSLDRAHEDYTVLIETFMDTSRAIEGRPLVDAFVINISSPNTKGLRELFSQDRLRTFLMPIAKTLGRFQVPGLLKLSPDMDDETRSACLNVICELELDGFIATNTTAARPSGFEHLPLEGGLSGAPLRIRSRDFLIASVKELGSRRDGMLIVSAGGVLDGEEARMRLDLGADCVQTYSGLVFKGPRFFDQALKNLV
jgi:dihydroorotate dehydrogenase